jgi:hypothetical protein
MARLWIMQVPAFIVIEFIFTFMHTNFCRPFIIATNIKIIKSKICQYILKNEKSDMF